MMSQEVLTTAVVRILTLFIGFFTSILTARYLGPEGRGEYFFVITLAMLLTQFAHLGLASSNTYLVAKQPNLLPTLLVNSIWVSLVVGFVVAGVTLMILSSVPITSPNGTWVLLFLVPASIFYLLGINLLVGINKIFSYNCFQMGSYVVLFGVIAWAGFSGGDVARFLEMSLLGWIVIAVLLFIQLRKLTAGTKARFGFDAHTLFQGASYSVKAYLVTLMGMLVLKGNVLFLRYYASEEVLGYYSIASQLNDCMSILPASIALVLFPNLIRNSKNRWQEMKKSLYLTLLIMLISCFVAGFLVKPFIQLAFGSRFLPAVDVFLFMLPGAFFLGLITIVSQYLSALGFPRQQVAIWFIALLVTVVSSVLLIPDYGGEGAALALSLAYFVLFFLIILLAKRQKEESLIDC